MTIHIRQSAGDVLYDDLKTRIRQGKLKPGDRLLGVRQLREQYQLSHYATVEAMNRLGREGFVMRRQGAGTYVADLPDYVTLGAHTRTIGVVLSGSRFSKMFMKRLVETLEEQMVTMGCKYTLVETTRETAGEHLVKRRADAFIWVCPSYKKNLGIPDVPVVMVAQDAEITVSRQAGYDILTADSRQGGALAARYLKDIGCRRVAILGVRDEVPCDHLPVTTLRIHGFEMEWGEQIPESMVFFAERYFVQQGVAMADRILALEPRPDAVFATSDELAQGLCYALIARGMRPGREMKVIGFDAQPMWSEGEQKLTSVKVPLEELGLMAAELAVRRAAKPQSTMRRIALACSLRKGETA